MPGDKKQTITFFAKSAEPNQFPSYAYAIAAHVPGHVKIVAYVLAVDTVVSGTATAGNVVLNIETVN